MMNSYRPLALQEETSYLARVAVILQRMVTISGFSDELALVCAGMCFDRAYHFISLQALQEQKRDMLRYPDACFSLDDKTLLKRYEVFSSFAKRWPTSASLMASDSNISRIDLQNLVKNSFTERSAAIKLVGGNEEQSKSNSSLYSKCRRLDKKLFRSSEDGKIVLGRSNLKIFIDPVKNFPIIEPPTPLPQPPRHCSLQNQMISTALQSPMSDMSTNFSLTPSQLSLSIADAPITTPAPSSAALVPARPSSTSIGGSCRRTAYQAQMKRKDEEENNEKRSIAFQVSTILVKKYKDKKLNWFGSVAAIVNAVNSFVANLDGAVSTREVIKAVHEDRIGKPPIKQGTKGKLPPGAFDALCDLTFSISAITQHNGDEALTRPEIINMIDSIVSPYFEEKSTMGMNKRTLHDRIQTRNATRMNVATRNRRENLRWRWFTFNNQLKHYINFEKFSVEAGFASWATDEQYETTGQKTIWTTEQRARYINVDEISFSLGYGDNGVGGREPMKFTVDGIRDSGEEEQKSSFKCTLLFGMNGRDEALPPLIILPSAAANPRIKKALLSRMPQVEGMYGLTEKKKYSCWIATSANGSMDGGIMMAYIEKLIELFPDARDERGFRICFKVDSGPGRKGQYNEVSFVAKQFGVIIYTSLPNSTEGTQEMDQVFSFLKTRMEINRSMLHRALLRAGLGPCKVEHLPIIIFGGDYNLKDDEMISVPKAFEICLSADHCRSGRYKCGYVPPNRNALYHDKCRREVEDEVQLVLGVPETNADMMNLINRIDSIYLDSGQTNNDGYKEMVLGIQLQNKTSIRKLLDLGFKFARMIGQRCIREEERDDEAESSIGVTTVPGTRERQDLMGQATRAGAYWKVTNGGAPLGCDDMLISMERLRMMDKAKDLEKERKELEEKLKTKGKALEILRDGGQPTRVSELKDCIMWKKGTTKQPKGKRGELLTLWGTVKNQPDPIGLDNNDLRQLEKSIKRLERGDIEEVEDTGLFKRAYARKCRVLHEQGMFLGEPERVQLLASLHLSLSEDGKQQLINLQGSIGANTEYVPTCLNYHSDEDDLRSHGEDGELQNEHLVDDEEGSSSESSLEDFDDQVPPLPFDDGIQDELVDDEGSSSESSLEDFDDHVPPTADDGMHDEPSSAITISYENMTKEELILQCKMKNIHADKRNFLKTQITKVLKADKEEEMQSLIQEDE
jgi:hypothetical protein